MKNQVVTKKVNDWLSIYQNTEDEFCNATALLEQYNKHYPTKQKFIADFLRLNNTKEYMEALKNLEMQEKEEKQHNGNSHLGHNQYVAVYYIKKGGNSINGRKPDTHYYHPLLFIKFACWLNPEMEVFFHKLIYNNVIKFRNAHGNFSAEFTDAIKKVSNGEVVNYIIPRAMIYKAVFGKYEPKGNQLNSATEDQLKHILKIQNDVVTLVNFGHIKTFDELKEHLKQYNKL